MASVDGRLMPAEEAFVPLDDRGFLLGDAVYETLRTYGGRLFALDAHLRRLEASLGAVQIGGVDLDTVRSSLRGAVAAAWSSRAAGSDVEVVARVTVTRGRGPHGMGTRGAGPPRVYVLARPLPVAPPSVYAAGVSVVTAKTRRVAPSAQHPMIKAASALNLVLARLEADAVGADEALLCDDAGRYLEATGANLFVVSGDRFHTARGEDGVLAGVTANRVMALLQESGLHPVFGPVPAELLRAADEVFLTQTTREVVPVVRVDGASVGSGLPGPWARRIRARFVEEVERWLDA